MRPPGPRSSWSATWTETEPEVWAWFDYSRSAPLGVLAVAFAIVVFRLPILRTISSGEVAEEIARTLVGSIGLVLAIPLTTVIAALVVTTQPVRRRHLEREAGHGHSHA